MFTIFCGSQTFFSIVRRQSGGGGRAAWRALGFAACGLSGFVLGGCSGTGSTGQSVGLLAANDQAAPRVPVVVPQPRPFRVAQLIRQARPAEGTPQPLAVPPAASPGDRIRLTAATVANEAPAEATPHLPAALPIAAGDADTEAAIRLTLHDYLRAFNLHDTTAVAAHWTARGTSVDLASGAVTNGREAVRRVLAALFEADDSATIDIDIGAIRPVRDDVAVIDGITRLSSAQTNPVERRFSAVMVRNDGRWRLESMHEAPHLSRPADGVPGRPLDDLAWLRGAWEDVSDGITASTDCFWSSGRGFLVRTHAIAPDHRAESHPQSGAERAPGLLPVGPAAPLELTEMIGWDPDREEIRSWIFTSTGRFAEGTWRREGDVWKVHVVGQGRDTGLACVCTLMPDGPDGLTITCDTDSLAHLLPATCRYVRTAR